MGLALFEKPLAALTADDVRELLGTAEESQILDFKERPKRPPSGPPGFIDWETDAQRKELAKDVVAFANADGGWLVLGVSERKGPPAIADAITPIPDPEALAEKLLAAIGSRIDPYPHGISARGIRTDSDSGVVVIRVQASSDVPHAVIRGEGSVAAYLRVNTESRPMSIRDIRNTTLEAARGIDAVEAYLSKQSQAFAQFDFDPPGKPAAGYRISIVPTRARYQVERLYAKPELLQRPTDWRFKNANDVRWRAIAPASQASNFNPTLRGVVSTSTAAGFAKQVLALETGAIETWYLREPIPDFDLYVGWVMGDFLSTCTLAHKIRIAAEQPDARLWCVVELVMKRTKAKQARVGSLKSENGSDYFPEPLNITVPLTLPVYEIGNASEFGPMSIRIANDIYNAGGQSDQPSQMTLVE